MRTLVPAIASCIVIAAAPAVVRGADVSVSVAARSIQPGELAVLTVTTPTPVDEVRVRGLGRDLTPIRVSETEWKILVGIDLETKPGRYDVSVVTGLSDAGRVTQLLTVLPRTFTTRKLTVDAAFVNPPPADVARITADTERLNRAWASSSEMTLWSGPWVRPVPGTSNSAFGTRSIYNGQPRSPHSGADFQGTAGTPVKTPNSGRVVLAGDLYFTGNTVVIDHGGGLFSLFAHLRAINVHEGDSVATGSVLGELGATGRVTGPHLHWAIRVNGARVDPLSLLALLGEPSQ